MTTNSSAQPPEERLRVRILVSASAFLVVWLVVNRDIFRHVMVAAGDVATILLQVHDAKRFHELLGNYSRWRFHHPGPGFMYIMALGDAVFRDVLRVVPAPLNSAALSLLVLYTCFLFGAIWIFQQRCDSPLFLPAAVAASLWFIYVVNRTFPGSASGGVWMPYVLMFCFLLFATACASLAAGKATSLPIVIFCGMLLVHGHVAQLLFVGVLSATAIGCWIVPEVRQVGLRSAIKRYRLPLLISLVIVVVFAFPILLEAALYRPNNLHNLFTYMQEHRGPQNSWLVSVKYISSFVAFIPDPEIVLLNPAAHLLSRGASRSYVLAYWGMFLSLTGLAVGLRLNRPAKISRFLKYVIFELALITILAIFWARKIAGGLFNFNTYFFFATFLLASFVLLSFLLNHRIPTRATSWTLLVACLLPLVMLAAPRDFAALQDPQPERLERQRRQIIDVVSNIPIGIKNLRIAWPQQGDWPITAGIASWLQDRDRDFCVPDYWGFMFGRRHVCQNLDGLENLEVVHQSKACVSPCRTIFQNDEIAANITPAAHNKLPFTLQTDDPAILAIDFNEPEGVHGPMWSKRRSAIRFTLANDWHPTEVVRIRVTGVTLPGRPLELSLNGQRIGNIQQPGLLSSEFEVAESVFRGGAGNELEFRVDGAAPVNKDPRTLGFQLWQIQILPKSRPAA